VEGYLFDASALSAYLNEDHPYHLTTRERIDSIPADALRLVSMITVAEIDYGIRFAESSGSPRLKEYRDRLETIRLYALLDLTRYTGEVYAELKAKVAARIQKKAGKKLPRWVEDWIALGSEKRLQIDENDLWICAQALERDITLVTGDSDMRNIQAVDTQLRLLITRD
jgi:tRNA(fMet)-specific endonuclease VapC